MVIRRYCIVSWNMSGCSHFILPLFARPTLEAQRWTLSLSQAKPASLETACLFIQLVVSGCVYYCCLERLLQCIPWAMNKLYGGIERRPYPCHSFIRLVSECIFCSSFSWIQSRSKCLPKHQHNAQHGNKIISTRKQQTQRKPFENLIHRQRNTFLTKADYLLSQTNQPDAFKTPPHFSTMTKMMDSFSSACHHQISTEATTGTSDEGMLNTPVKGM